MAGSINGDRFRVLLVSPYFAPQIGGIENHVYELAGRLSQKYYIDIITTGSFSSVVSFGKKGRVSFRRVWFSPLNNPINFTLLFNLLRKDFSLIHVHGLYQFTSIIGILAATLKRRCSLITMHGRPFYRGSGKRAIQRVYESVFLKKILTKSSRIIGLTNSDRNFLISLGIQRNKIVIIPNAVDTQIWKPVESKINKDSLKSRFILYVGAFIERKNPEMVLEAYYIISKEGYPGDLIMVGSGALEQNLKQKVDELDIQKKVKFLSGIPQKDLLNLYRKADLLVHPSSMEGLPTVILESMAAAVIVISSNIDSVKNLIYDGKNGFLFNLRRNNLAQVISHVLSLSNSDKERIRIEARRTIVNNFSWSLVANKTLGLYRELMSFA